MIYHTNTQMVLTIGKLCTRLHVPFGNYICSCAQQLQAVVMKAILDKPGSRMEDLYYIILTRNATEVEKALKVRVIIPSNLFYFMYKN